VLFRSLVAGAYMKVSNFKVWHACLSAWTV
jgi:hypothetical protein